MKLINDDFPEDYDPLKEEREFWDAFHKRQSLELSIANSEITNEEPQDIMSDKDYEEAFESQRCEREERISREVCELIEWGFTPNEVSKPHLQEVYDKIMRKKNKGGKLL